MKSIRVNQIVPLALLSSFGAPVIFALVIGVASLVSQNFDPVLLLMTFVTVGFFSLLLTLGTGLLIFAISRLLHVKLIRLDIAAIAILLVLTALAIAFFGLARGAIFLVLTGCNVILLLALIARSARTEQSGMNKGGHP